MPKTATMLLWLTLTTLLCSIWAHITPRPSCTEHYLHGHTESGVYPLADDNGEVYRVTCSMPQSAERDFRVGLEIRTALERWHPVGDKPSTIGYQVADRAFFRRLVDQSTACSQELWIRWPEFTGNLSETHSFTTVSLFGLEETYTWNGTESGHDQNFVLPSSHAGLLHLKPTQPNNYTSSVQVRTSALHCVQDLRLQLPTCRFDLTSPADRLEVEIDRSHKTSVSFRTSQFRGRLLILDTGRDSVSVNLIDGYLLQIGENIIPVGFLANSEWHTFTWDRHEEQLQLDDLTPVSLNMAVNSIKVTLNGQVAGIRRDYGAWTCQGEKGLDVKLVQLTNRVLCHNDKLAYCNCRGPHSALSASARPVECPMKPKTNTTFTLYRDPRMMSFFYLPEYDQAQPISILIKTDSNVGLIFFGQHNRSTVGQERFQVQFEGEFMTAGACSRLRDPEQLCLSCAIHKKGGFATNEWTRVSLFYYHDLAYLAVDSQICQLTEDARRMDMADLYSMASTVNSVLFVGSGTAYAKKLYQGEEFIKEQFRAKFFENTREKAPSLRGCVADLRVGGRVMDLHDVFVAQQKEILNNQERQKKTIFSITDNCVDCDNLKSKCHGARCRLPAAIVNSAFVRKSQPVCDCASVFSDRNPFSGECEVSARERTTTKPTALSLSRATKVIHLNHKPSFVKYARVQRFWALVRFPSTADLPISILDFGRIRVLAANFGKTVIIEDQSGEREDQRLHLVAVERNPSVGTNSADRSLNFRVDSQVRRINLDIFPIDEISSAEVHIHQARQGFGGCLSELSLAFDYDDSITGTTPSDNRVEQVEVLREMLERPEWARSVDELLLYGDECGIRDPAIWESASTPLGQLGVYDPDEEYDFSWVLKLALVLLNMMAILVVLSICAFFGLCWYKNRRHVYKTVERGYVSAEEYIKLFKEYGEDDRSEDSAPRGIPPLDERPESPRSPGNVRRVHFKHTPTSIEV